jgi:Zn finger protein HypA/HybF involved in hydrogenase expression
MKIKESISNIKESIIIFLYKIGFYRRQYPKLTKCLNCPKELTGRQKMFCSKNCCSEYHNVKQGDTIKVELKK